MKSPLPDEPRAPSRRQVFRLLVSTALGVVLVRRAVAGPLDQGIGGTGVAPPTDESDRGIGGTGVIGTIRKFGSIIVNDLRIAYAPDADVRIDGQPASVADLRIGQVVRVAATGPDGSLSTRVIDVTSEVVGPVEKTGGKQLIVLGQKVVTTGLKTAGLKPGDVVAVSGLRRNDGTIVASLIERSPGAASRLAGPLAQSRTGGLNIAGLGVSGVDPSLVGRRVVLDGLKTGDFFVATRATSEATLLPPSIRTLSIESYVERTGDSLQLGSGFAVAGTAGLDVPSGRSVRAVVQANIGADGQLSVNSLRTGGRTYGSSPNGLPSRGIDGAGGRGAGPGGARGPGAGAGGAGGAGGNGPGSSGFGGNGPGNSGPGGSGPSGGGFGGGGFGGPGGGFGGPGGRFGGGGPGGGGPGGGGFGGGGPGGGGFGGGGRH